MTLRTLNYGNHGIFLIMGNAGFCPSTVLFPYSPFLARAAGTPDALFNLIGLQENLFPTTFPAFGLPDCPSKADTRHAENEDHADNADSAAEDNSSGRHDNGDYDTCYDDNDDGDDGDDADDGDGEEEEGEGAGAGAGEGEGEGEVEYDDSEGDGDGDEDDEDEGEDEYEDNDEDEDIYI